MTVRPVGVYTVQVPATNVGDAGAAGAAAAEDAARTRMPSKSKAAKHNNVILFTIHLPWFLNAYKRALEAGESAGQRSKQLE